MSMSFVSTDVIMERMVIEVRGIPEGQPDRMRDQLKIHFLRRSNNGGEVLEVLYPARGPGQAYVIFESEDVPGVLKHAHALEVDSKFYPLQVQKARLSEVDMGAETTLDINRFPQPQKVRQLIEVNGFEATELRDPGHLYLKGTFLNLKHLRKQLTQLLAQDVQPQYGSPALPNGYASASSASVSRTGPYNLEGRYATKSSLENGHTISNGVHARNRSPIVDGASPFVGVSPASLNFQPTSTAYGGSGGPSSLSNLSDDLYLSRLPSSRREAKVLVDKDILSFVYVCKQEFITEINTIYGTEMTLKDDNEITTVEFRGQNCQKVQAKFQTFIDHITPQLRTQEIHLKDYSPRQQVQIRERIKHYKDYGVLIKPDNDIIKLVGSSTRSYLVKQMLLDFKDDPSMSNQRGRELERNSRLRRSSSLPGHNRSSKAGEAGQVRSPVPDYQASVAKDYYPSHDQVETQTRRAAQTQSSVKQVRGRSQDRNVRSRETRDLPKHSEPLLPAGGQGQKTAITQAPKKGNLWNIPLNNKTDFKQRLKRV